MSSLNKLRTLSVDSTIFGTETIQVIESKTISVLSQDYINHIFTPAKATCDQDHTPALLKKQGTSPIIGILGGMGPEASLKLLSMVDKKYPNATIYLLMITKTPDRTQAILNTATLEPQKKIHHIFKHASQFLTDLGCQTILMPCNTAHYFAKSVKNLTSMVKAVSSELKKIALDSIVILSTQGTRDAKIYTDLPAPRVLTLNDTDQTKITSAIYEVKAKGVTDNAIDLFASIVKAYCDQDHTTFGLCCTELPLIANDPRTPKKIAPYTPRWIDPVSSMVNHLEI
jgi:aspartate racemase